MTEIQLFRMAVSGRLPSGACTEPIGWVIRLLAARSRGQPTRLSSVMIGV